MAKSPNWTKEEIEILEKNYPILGCNMCELLPGRTSKSINVKASRMGLKIEFDRKWTDLENSILVKLYPDHGTNSITLSAIPNRSADSIRIHASRLGFICNKLDGKKKPLNIYLEELSILGITLLGEYTGSTDKILHKCNACMYEWHPTPNNLVQGSGCPNCNIKFGFKHTIGYLYLLNINGLFLKVGITSRPILCRITELCKELNLSIKDVELVRIKEYSGNIILNIESSILTNPILKRYAHPKKFPGCTELFNISELNKLEKIFDEDI